MLLFLQRRVMWVKMLEHALHDFLQVCNYDVAAEKALFYIDELDKIARRSGDNPITRDVGGEGVQQVC